METAVARHQESIARLESREQDVDTWVGKIKEHLDAEDLDRAALLDLIDSIYVSEPYKTDGVKTQDIKIK